MEEFEVATSGGFWVAIGDRIDDAFDFFVSETDPFEAGSMLGKPQRSLSEPLRGLLILRFVSNHGDTPGFNLMMPRGFPSRRD